MATTAENTAAASALVKSQLGLTGLPNTEWTYEQRIEYNEALAAYIRDNPDQFSTVQVSNATIEATRKNEALQSDSILDQAGEFVAEVANQAEDLNPFSERNRTKTVILIAGLAFTWIIVNAWAKAGAPIPRRVA